MESPSRPHDQNIDIVDILTDWISECYPDCEFIRVRKFGGDDGYGYMSLRSHISWPIAWVDGCTVTISTYDVIDEPVLTVEDPEFFRKFRYWINRVKRTLGNLIPNHN